MDKQALQTRIETLRVAIAINSRFLAEVPAGADKKTERQVEADRLELEKIREQLVEVVL